VVTANEEKRKEGPSSKLLSNETSPKQVEKHNERQSAARGYAGIIASV
jgi:hypothetical protein